MKEKSPLRQKDIRTGVQQERKRVLALWKAEMKCLCEEPMQHLASLIKEESK